MSNAVVEWAEKMAGVLNEKIQRAKDSVAGEEQVAPRVAKGGAGGNGAPTGGGGAAKAGGAPAGGGGGGGAPAGGGGGGGGAPAAKTGGAPNTGAAKPGDATGGGAKPADAGGDAAPTGGGASTKPVAQGNDAKAYAEMAKKSLEEVNAIATTTKADEADSKKIFEDAQGGKKQVDEAKQKAEAAEKSIPPAPKVPAPQGKDDKAKYESAIKITADVRKVQGEADDKSNEVYEQASAAEIGVATIQAAVTAAKKSAQKLAKASEQARFAAEGAVGAANTAASKAAESKQKADAAAKQAADAAKSTDKEKADDKSKPPAGGDAAELKKKAEEDAKYAAEAKDAGAKAEAAAKQVEAAAKAAETQNQAIEKLASESKTVEEAVKSKSNSFYEKVQPHFTAVSQASDQELQCQQKLSEEDVESVLQHRYAELGGDPELTKAFADEDKEFGILTEAYRADLKRWQETRIRELDDHKRLLEAVLKSGDAVIPPSKKWLQTEDSPATEKIKADAQALGPDKLGTEPGKQLMHEINTRTEKIAEVKKSTEYNEKMIEKVKAEMETLKERYKDVEKQYEAGETRLKEQRTELDNFMEIEQHNLEMKVILLQNRPKPVRDKMKKNLENELSRINKLAALEAKAEAVPFDPAPDPVEATPLDWKPVQEMIEKLKAASVEDLKKDDPKLADIRKEYEQAGGDEALFNKRVAKWQQDVEALKKFEEKQAKDFQDRSGKMQDHAAAADEKLRDATYSRDSMKETIGYRKESIEQLNQQEKDSGPLSTEDKARKTLLERELKRNETELKNLEAECQAAASAKANAEKLVEQDRDRFEHLVDDDANSKKKPTSDDISKLPLPAKYTELTGKSVPA
jgi:hypothetical protein